MLLELQVWERHWKIQLLDERLNRTESRREIKSRSRSRWQTGGPPGSPIGCVNHEGWSHLEIISPWSTHQESDDRSAWGHTITVLGSLTLWGPGKRFMPSLYQVCPVSFYFWIPHYDCTAPMWAIVSVIFDKLTGSCPFYSKAKSVIRLW